MGVGHVLAYSLFLLCIMKKLLFLSLVLSCCNLRADFIQFGVPTVINSTSSSSGSSANAVTNYASPEGVIVTSFATNIVGVSPFIVSNSPNIFGPWKGTDYIQQAINYLPQYSSRGVVGGGKILVLGNNYTPQTLIFSNSLGGISSWSVESPTLMGNAIIGNVNPVMRFQPVVISGLNLQDIIVRNLMIASQTNQCTNIFEISPGFGNARIENNWFGYWKAMTNNNDAFGTTIGLITSVYNDAMTNAGNLVVYLDGLNSDSLYIKGNAFWGINCLNFWADHGRIEDNYFYFCGRFNTWTNASIFSLGSAVVFGDRFSGSDVFSIRNYFYGNQASYSIRGTENLQGVGTFYFNSDNDRFESQIRGAMLINDNSGFGYPPGSWYTQTKINYTGQRLNAPTDYRVIGPNPDDAGDAAPFSIGPPATNLLGWAINPGYNINSSFTKPIISFDAELSGDGYSITNLSGVRGLIQSNYLACTVQTNICVYTTPSGATNTYQVGGWINVLAVTTDVIQAKVIFTDEKNVSQTIGLMTSGISTVQFSPMVTSQIRCKGGTTIILQATLTTSIGSITYDCGGNIESK